MFSKDCVGERVKKLDTTRFRLRHKK